MEWELQLPSLVTYDSHDAGIGLACLAGVSQDTPVGSGDAPAAKRWKGKARKSREKKPTFLPRCFTSISPFFWGEVRRSDVI